MRNWNCWTAVPFYCALVLSAAITDCVFGGDVTFVRRPDENWHSLGPTYHISGMTVNLINAGAAADIDAGLPSVIAPLTDAGDDTISDTYSSADVTYTGELAGTFDYQNVIDHSAISEFTSELDFTSSYWGPLGISDMCRHEGGDHVAGSLDLSIDGDGVQWIDVSWESDWTSGGIATGSAAEYGTFFDDYTVDLTVFRNAVPVVQITGNVNGLVYADLEGFDHINSDSGEANIEGDWTLGSIAINDQVGFWAHDGDIVTYELTVTYQFNSYLGDGTGHFDGAGIFNWRLALEDSGLH